MHCRNCGREVVVDEPRTVVHADGRRECRPAFCTVAEVEEPCS